MAFEKATRKKARLRMGLLGPAGSGKTFTALRMAAVFAGKGRVAVIDTEHGSASLYVDEPNPDGGAFDFDVVDLSKWPNKFTVENYIQAIKMAGEAGYPVLVVDSLSHAWEGEGGLLEFVDNVASRSNSKNSFNAWREATPLHNTLVNTLLSYPGHIIVTLRTKVEYILETNSKGKQEPKKIGMKPIQRDGLDYEFTVVGDIDVEQHKLVITKSRCSAVAGKVYPKAGGDLAKTLLEWLNKGTEEAVEPGPEKAAAEPAPPVDEYAGPDGKHAWTDQQCSAFQAAISELLSDLKAPYEAVKAFTLERTGYKPSSMNAKLRGRVLSGLQDPDGMARFRAWLQENAEAHPAKASREPGEDESDAQENAA